VLTPILLAVFAAALVAMLGLLLRRPREWAMRTAYRSWLALSPRRHEDMHRAIERIAATLAHQINQQDGNPDDEYYEDLYRWFTGDPNANIDYSRKQQRDRERLERGDFNPR
jgi:hypothetical protein